MGKPKLPNYTRYQADAAVATLLRLADAMLEHDSYQDVYDEAQGETKGRIERFKTLQKKSSKVVDCIQECRDMASALRTSMDMLRRSGF